MLPTPAHALLALGLATALLPAVARAGALGGLRVYDRTSGETLPVYRHEGRNYVAGVPGHAYELAVSNKTPGRLLAVVSVDGVNALSGETAGADQRGYVFAPYATDRVKGWRKSLNSVARFTFAALPNSYAARTGRPDNVGVIGVALFRERAPVAVEEPYGYNEDRSAEAVPAPPVAARSRAAPAPGSAAAQASAAKPSVPPETRQGLGTGHGRRLADRVETTTFERASDAPDEVLTIYYDARPALVARGVVPRDPPPRAATPNAFPGGFVPDP